MANRKETMIRVKEPTREMLERLRIIPEEPYNSVIVRLLEAYKRQEASQ